VDWTESHYSDRTAMRLARAGALVRVVAAEDACAVCKAKTVRIYRPSEVPRLPIRGCQNERCRCRFEAVDPETELTVSQLVERGIHALRSGRRSLARKILEHVVSLDEMHELGWLWLSAVVEDRDKVRCLEKVLAINPRNKNAQAGLESLREKLGSLDGPPAVSQEPPVVAEPESVEEKPEPAPTDGAAALPEASLPAELITVRAERQIIVEQWTEFVSIAPQIDSRMLLVQAKAFLTQLKRYNQQAVETLSDGNVPQETELDELYLQWHESDEIGEALARVIEEHQATDPHVSGWQPTQDALRTLAQQVLEHRDALRDAISTTGGATLG
jgi:hypothetical protein